MYLKGNFFLSSQSLPFTKIAHSITAQDHQPTPDSCIMSMVVGQLKVSIELALCLSELNLTQTFDLFVGPIRISLASCYTVCFLEEKKNKLRIQLKRYYFRAVVCACVCVCIHVCQADEDQVLGFQQTFLLKPLPLFTCQV